MKKLVGRGALFSTLLALALVGCSKKQASLPPPLAPIVDVEHPVLRDVTEYEYFTGRTEAADSIEIRSRVSGYLKTAPVAKSEAKKGEIREGDDVTRDTILFEIDPNSFEAEAERARANVYQFTALKERLDSDYRRARSLSGSRAMSREELDKIIADRNQAEASLKGAKASLNLAEVNLAYTKIRSPINGRLSRRNIDPGNLVKADETILTTIVRLDPMYASFDMDERTVLRFKEMLSKKEILSTRARKLEVRLALANEKAFKYKGEIDFIDNRLDVGTGTLRIRAKMNNPKLDNGLFFMSPGMFIRMQLPVGTEHQAMLVPEAALASKQGQKVVYVVRHEQAKDADGDPVYDDDGQMKMIDRVYEIAVEPGQLEDKWRAIKSSGRKEAQAKAGPGVPPGQVGHELKPSDRIVVSGLQRVRDKGEVRIAEPEHDTKQAAPPKAKAPRS